MNIQRIPELLSARSIVKTLIVSLSFLSYSLHAQPVLYGVTGDGAGTPETLYELDQSDGSLTFITTLGNGTDGEEIAFNVDDGLIYHASGFGDDIIFDDEPVLETIDPDTLAITPITLSGDVFDEVTGLTYDANSSKLFAGSQKRLFSITTTGVSTYIGESDPNLKGLAFAATTLYTMDGGKTSLSLITIDRADAFTVEEIEITFPPFSLCDPSKPEGKCDGKVKHSFTALATHPETGDLWAVLVVDYGNTTGKVRRLAVIDPVTAVGAFIADDPLLGLADKIAGLAFGPVPDPIGDLIEAINKLIADTTTPAKAQTHLLKTIDKLEKAQDKLDEGDVEKALGELTKTAKELEKAGKDDADVEEIMTALLDYARRLAESAADAVRSLSGTNFRVDQFLAKMEVDLLKAEVEAANGKVEKAIKAFKDAVKHANGAAAAVPHGELEGIAQGVINLNNNPATPAAAQPDLLKAIDKLEKAQEKLDNGDTVKGIEDTAEAAKKLEKAAENGAFTAGLVDSLVEIARSLANESANLAYPLGGTNAQVDEKLAKMEEKLIEAEEKVAAGDLEKAIKEFSGAVKEAEKAIDESTAP